MEDKRFVCGYPQGKYCGNSNCSLSHICCRFPVFKVSFRHQMKFGKHNKINGIRKTEAEKKEHQNLYCFYNCLFGDLRDKKIAYARNHYQINRERILRDKRRNVSHHLFVVQKQFCNGECENCIYDDCIIPMWNNRNEYSHLYREVFQEKLKAKKADYRNTHRAFLNNSGKLRNYKKKGYIMSKCILKETNNPDYKNYEGTFGVLSIIKIQGNDYISFISLDREFSFRAKINKRLNDLSNPICKEAYYSDYDDFNYTFESTVNPGNPLWEMEHNDNFVRCSNVK